MSEPEAMFYDPYRALLIELGVSRRLRARLRVEHVIDAFCCRLIAHHCWPMAVVIWRACGLW